MTASSWINGAAAVIAVGAATIAGGRIPSVEGDARPALDPASAIADASGHVTTVRAFHRIVSGSVVADRLLAELCEPDRVVAFTAHGAEHSLVGYRYAGKAILTAETDVEQIVALNPDLFLTNSYGAPDKLARLREAGIEVFDLGEARGVDSLLADARLVAALLGHPERGIRFAETFSRRFDRIAASVPPNERKRAMYLSVYGSQLFGGSTGTSYHDVLTHAGLIDAASPQFVGWPQYSSEQVLAIDPEIIVTKAGMKQALCGQALFARLKSCTTGTVVEVPGDLLDDPGPTMEEAAEQILAAVYGGRRLQVR